VTCLAGAGQAPFATAVANADRSNAIANANANANAEPWLANASNLHLAFRCEECPHFADGVKAAAPLAAALLTGRRGRLGGASRRTVMGRRVGAVAPFCAYVAAKENRSC
jgi:hypothetical protein